MRHTIILLLVLATLSPAWAGSNTELAMDWLSRGLKERQQMLQILAALRSTEDQAVLPLFVALGKNKDQELRKLAPSVIMQIGGESQAPGLLKQMADDTQPEIRSEVLLYLNSLKAVDTDMLTAALAVKDERLQCLAARSLVRIGQGQLALQTLRDLSKSTDQATSAMARMALLALGSSDQMPELTKLVKTPTSQPAVLMLMLEEAAELDVKSAIELAETVAHDPDRPMRLRTHAYKTLTKLASDGPARLTKAIVKTEQPMPIYLLVLLSQTDQAEGHLKTLAGKPGMIGTLARFELARKADAPQLARMAAAAIELEHPIVINYVLERAMNDLEDRPRTAVGYQEPVIALLAEMRSKRRLDRAQMDLVSSAGRVLGEIGTDRSLGQLKEMLAGRFNAFTRALAAGMIQVKNPDIAKVVTDLLDSPYDELATSAAFCLGKLSNKAAAGKLSDIVRQESRYRPTLVALASWYLLKIDNAESASVQELAELLK